MLRPIQYSLVLLLLLFFFYSMPFEYIKMELWNITCFLAALSFLAFILLRFLFIVYDAVTVLFKLCKFIFTYKSCSRSPLFMHSKETAQYWAWKSVWNPPLHKNGSLFKWEIDFFLQREFNNNKTVIIYTLESNIWTIHGL